VFDEYAGDEQSSADEEQQQAAEGKLERVEVEYGSRWTCGN
jgi:hypothetical protein